MHKYMILRLLLSITMFSASARAFSSLAVRPTAVSAARLPFLVTRSMSAAGGADTSIVDICKQKITTHLGTDEVTVTGR